MDRFFYYALGAMAALVLVVLGVALLTSGEPTPAPGEADLAVADTTAASPTPDEATDDADQPRFMPQPTPTPSPRTPPNPGKVEVVAYPGFNVVYSLTLGSPLAVQYAMVNDAKPQRYDEPPKVATPDEELIVEAGYFPGRMAAENSIELYFGRTASKFTELMTNLAAFHPGTLEGPWAAFPELEQRWAGTFGWIEVVAGPIFDDPPQQSGGVLIPSGFYRAYRRSYGDTIAFIIPQGASATVMKNYLTSIEAIEAATGMEIFANTVALEERSRVAEAVW